MQKRTDTQTGTLKMREMENAEKKMRHKIVGVENAGKENAGKRPNADKKLTQTVAESHRRGFLVYISQNVAIGHPQR